MARPRSIKRPKVADETTERAFAAVETAVTPVLRMALVERVAAPSSPTSRGEPGQFAAVDGWLYVVVAPNRWQRVAIGGW